MRRETELRAMYEAFNVRDIDVVLRQMTEDVDWPNALEGGRVHGHDGVREYWTRQWSAIHPTTKPVADQPTLRPEPDRPSKQHFHAAIRETSSV